MAALRPVEDPPPISLEELAERVELLLKRDTHALSGRRGLINDVIIGVRISLSPYVSPLVQLDLHVEVADERAVVGRRPCRVAAVADVAAEQHRAAVRAARKAREERYNKAQAERKARYAAKKAEAEGAKKEEAPVENKKEGE